MSRITEGHLVHHYQGAKGGWDAGRLASARGEDRAGPALSEPVDGPTAVIYLRVSTKEQAEKGGGEEGYSIPAQRNANLAKADQLGASVVQEFVDAGESARKADRPALMRMIKYVAEHRINYCIVQ